MDAARRRGKQIGRPYSLTPDAITSAHSAITQGERSRAEIALALGVSRMTLDRAFERMGLN
jgi:DNA invertase Pin-like site-specific DNA recombinase